MNMTAWQIGITTYFSGQSSVLSTGRISTAAVYPTWYPHTATVEFLPDETHNSCQQIKDGCTILERGGDMALEVDIR